jgi:hypothetical protein
MRVSAHHLMTTETAIAGRQTRITSPDAPAEKIPLNQKYSPTWCPWRAPFVRPAPSSHVQYAIENIDIFDN